MGYLMGILWISYVNRFYREVRMKLVFFLDTFSELAQSKEEGGVRVVVLIVEIVGIR